jgi:hypothetical protein
MRRNIYKLSIGLFLICTLIACNSGGDTKRPKMASDSFDSLQYEKLKEADSIPYYDTAKIK